MTSVLLTCSNTRTDDGQLSIQRGANTLTYTRGSGNVHSLTSCVKQELEKLLDNQETIFDDQGRLLDDQGKLFDDRGKLLDGEGKLLDDQGKLLDNQGKLLDN